MNKIERIVKQIRNGIINEKLIVSGFVSPYFVRCLVRARATSETFREVFGLQKMYKRREKRRETRRFGR